MDQPEVRQAETRIHGHRVAYRVAGDPQLPVVLLVHGITSSSATWDPVMSLLAEQAHVVAPDLYGHGLSDVPGADFSLGGFATQLRDLMDTLGHDRATVVGHSLGGGVAMQFAYQYIERCERLVLVDSGGFGREVSRALRAGTLPGVELVLPVIANRPVRNAGVAASRLLSRLPVRPRPRPSTLEVVRGYSTLAESPSRAAFVHTLRSVVEPGGQRISAVDRLYLVEGRPTLIVWGARDTVIPLDHAHIAHEAIPGSVLEVFEQSEHFPHLDEPGRFARLLLDFLASTEGAVLDHATVRERMAQRARAGANAGLGEAEVPGFAGDGSDTGTNQAPPEGAAPAQSA